MHPLTPDLSEMPDAELQKIHTDLISKLSAAYRFGNPGLVNQIQMVLEDYTAEISRRQHKIMEELAAKSDKFKGIIDIK